MADNAENVIVTNNPELLRYEAHLGGDLAGFAAYRLDGDRIVFTHTEVDPAFEGKGIGSSLARGALDDVRANGGLTVLPLCPFIKGWIAKHEDYQDLLAH
ncbi:GNAT family N-acetyltransferase [Knoellia subterranea]|uniref:Acetyltransferase n=1 Tax=Knoellia subterranea KCTC 19937 TaxID=1385521 RepID=A0A0A0JM44_9MICO|nr:GNAT family N-acetyltransferase [Knoellia subterranea]KGN37107.1 acetyltransferase [Knoellia subterranea KCTC 19937]